MVSQTSRTDGKIQTLEEFGRDLARRREALGEKLAEAPRNDGTRRTASKRSLLAAIETAGGNWQSTAN